MSVPPYRSPPHASLLKAETYYESIDRESRRRQRLFERALWSTASWLSVVSYAVAFAINGHPILLTTAIVWFGILMLMLEKTRP